jgi:hypothetical protein
VKVSELIAALRHAPEDAQVMVVEGTNEIHPITAAVMSLGANEHEHGERGKSGYGHADA